MGMADNVELEKFEPITQDNAVIDILNRGVDIIRLSLTTKGAAGKSDVPNAPIQNLGRFCLLFYLEV
jgi:hypothetical protein